MPKVAIADIELNYHEEGTGFPLILIHGLSDDARLWTPLIPELSKKYRTIAWDLRGHGRSGKLDMPYSFRQFSDDLFEFLRELDISQTHLLGLSMGGAIAQQFALDHPEKVRSLILLSTFSYTDPDLRETFKRLRNNLIEGGCQAFFDAAVKLTVTPEFASAHADEIATVKEEMVTMNSPTALVHAIDACMGFNVADRLSQLSLPTLIISGREDTFIPLHFSEQIHRSIPGSKWKILDGVAHNVLIPEKIPELSQLVLEFLATQ
ncbi:MAG TPA: alpha/beta fold hydrolase [Desulfobacteria bacterium]|nr:alpha/beta fold hydrolase [Desulfobacteria bacterium]